jgi:hypothetical protein
VLLAAAPASNVSSTIDPDCAGMSLETATAVFHVQGLALIAYHQRRRHLPWVEEQQIPPAHSHERLRDQKML